MKQNYDSIFVVDTFSVSSGYFFPFDFRLNAKTQKFFNLLK